jgi:hypothetical protein
MTRLLQHLSKSLDLPLHNAKVMTMEPSREVVILFPFVLSTPLQFEL